MKIKSLKINNFRCYKNETCIKFENLTAIIGKNDAGKSTILEALDIFFHDGKGVVKLDKDDINRSKRAAGDNDIKISICFTDLPSSIIIDDSNCTTLQNEYLLNKDDDLEIIKVFKNGSNTSSNLKVYIKAYHPTNSLCSKLLLYKQADLCNLIKELNISCSDKRKNAVMRAAIWDKFSKEELALSETELDVNTKEGDLKEIWTKIQKYMPYYSLFQSDRKNTDGDDEVQDPLKEAVKQIIIDEDIIDKLNYVAEKVRNKLQEVSNLTLEKIREMNPNIANSLHPRFPMTQDLKWADVFKGLSITGDEDIPINKRGSGVKRLILLNFFRAEAERKANNSSNQCIIYGIEEPETAQHKQHQKMLIEALKKLSMANNAQIIITTHSGDIVKQLSFNQIRVVCEDNGNTIIRDINKKSLPYPSLNEVNYIAFEDVNEEYHNELYGYLQRKAIEENPRNQHEKDFDNWLESKGCPKDKKWTREKDGITQSTQNTTIETYIRNFIHHPENKINEKYTIEELTNSINKMKDIVSSLS